MLRKLGCCTQGWRRRALRIMVPGSLSCYSLLTVSHSDPYPESPVFKTPATHELYFAVWRLRVDNSCSEDCFLSWKEWRMSGDFDFS